MVDLDLVFCTSIGTPLNPDMDILKPLKGLLKEAELPNIRFHDLRHSAATLLLGMGVHPKIAQEILGHSNVSITLNVYSLVLTSMQKDAMDMMNDAFMKQGEKDNELSENSYKPLDS